jgi:cardiolipin synthase A/B
VHPARREGGTSRLAHRSRVFRCTLLMGAVLVAASCAQPSTTTSTRPTSAPTASPATTSTTTRPPASGTRDPAKVTTRTAVPAPTWSLVIEPNDGMRLVYSLMSSARHELDMTMYELADPQAVGILESDAARGVIVRVILDQDYSGASVNAAAYSQLRAHGVQVHWAPSGTIFHQKTITVDDRTSAIMTLNLTSEYYPSSRDFAVITTDHSDVAAIEEVFATDWSSPGPPRTGPPGANLVWSPGAEVPILALIGSARHSLLVENEEMDDWDIVNALGVAARRGVVVEVVMTYSSSWATEFQDLVAAGVKVSTYSSDAPLYIHAKVIVADGTTAFVGSQNFSDSSLSYNRELGLITTEPTLVRPIAETVASDFAGATPLSSPPPSTARAWCKASASPANDGYAGDYDVYVHSNQPDKKATASDSGDTYSRDTDDSGYAVIDLWHTSPGETITVTVGGATCSTSA